jgi:hypothetical protein
LGNLKLLQEEREPSYNEAESHQSQARANPRQKSSLGSQIIPQVGAPPTFCWLIHFSVSPNKDSEQFAAFSIEIAPR